MNTNQPGGNEPEFPNDKITDVILHKDDEPTYGDDKDGSEKPVEEWTGDGVNDGNCWFPIHFDYEGKHYTADVQQKQNIYKEYHVSGVTPVIDHLPIPFVIAEHFTKEKYDYPVNEEYYPVSLGEALLKAIEEGSEMKL